MDVDENTAVARVKEMDSEEPLLQENPKRFVVFPIKHADIWQFYKKAEGKFFSFALKDQSGSLYPFNTCIESL